MRLGRVTSTPALILAFTSHDLGMTALRVEAGCVARESNLGELRDADRCLTYPAWRYPTWSQPSTSQG